MARCRITRGGPVTLLATVLVVVAQIGAAIHAQASVGRLPATLRITSITDASHTPALPLPVAAGRFDVRFQVLDGYGNLVTSPDVTVFLSALNGPGTLVSTPVISHDGTGVLAAYYSVGLTGLQLRVSSLGLAPATAVVDVAADGSGIGLPSVGLTLTAGNLSLPTGLAIASLPNGANGPVSLTIGPCVPDATTSCPGALAEIALTGNFKDDHGNPLYSDASPASMSWSCNAVVCPPPAFVPGSTPLSQLQAAEYRAHPMYVSMRDTDGSYQPFEPAPTCNGSTGSPIPTGVINPSATQGEHFCVDVGAITRADEQCTAVCSAWSGAVTLPVLFAEDPRFMAT